MTTVSALAFAPLLPWSVLALLAVLVAAVCGLALACRARGAWWRLAALAVPLVALANPHWNQADSRGLPDVAVVVVDDTLSQKIGDRQAQTEAALQAVQGKLAGLPNLDVRVTRVVSGSGDDGTRLFSALTRAIADIPRQRLAGAVMITDGQVHDVPADLGRDFGAPIQVLLTGHPGEIDRRLVLRDSPSFALVGHSATLRFLVEDPGDTGTAIVTARVDGAPYLATRVPVGREASVEIPITHAGQTVVELTVEPGRHELSLANNRVAVGVTGVRDRLRVLLISGEPNPGERTWRNFLKSDPAVDLVHFTILRDPNKDDGTPTSELSLIPFPVRELFEEKLHQFDLVIFDRYRKRGVLTPAYYQALVDYVRDGGALLMAVGPEFDEADSLDGTALSGILPARNLWHVVAQPFLPQVSALGRRHPVTAGLPGDESGGSPHWGRWLRQMAAAPKSGATVMTGADGLPLLILDRVGEGRVAELFSDTVWLWARGWEGGGPYSELLRRLAHWLMREPDLEEDLLTASVAGDRLEVVRHSLVPDPTPVTVTRPDGGTFALPLVDHDDGRETGAAAIDQPGLWRVGDGRHAAIAAAGTPNPLELSDLVATDKKLAPVAAATGGAVHWLAEGGVPEIRQVEAGGTAAGNGWIGLWRRDGQVITGLRSVPLLPGLLVLAVALAGFVLAWRRESR